MPDYQGNFQAYVPNTHVFGVYDVGAGDPGNLSLYDVEMSGNTTSDSAAGFRRLKAAWLGNVELGSSLSVFVGNGDPLTAAGQRAMAGRTAALGTTASPTATCKTWKLCPAFPSRPASRCSLWAWRASCCGVVAKPARLVL